MAAVADDLDQMPVVRGLADFDPKSGNLLERLVFNNRLAMVVVCAIITVVLGYFAATRLVLNASFEKMIPQSQPYIKNYLTYQKDLRGLGNAIRVVVENTDGDIFDPQYLEVLKQINDELFLTPGVDRAWVKSLWTPGVRWTEVTEEGFRGGPVMPDSYNGSPQSVEQLKQNIARSGIVGSLVANNFKSSMIFVPLLDKEPGTGKRIDYHGLSKVLEEKIRDKYELAKTLDKTVAGQGDADDQDPRHRLRQADRRADRRPAQGDDVLRHRGADRHRASSTPTRAACAAPRWSSPARWSRWSGSWAWSRSSASSSTRSRSWCRSWCSRSACRTARRR